MRQSLDASRVSRAHRRGVVPSSLEEQVAVESMTPPPDMAASVDADRDTTAAGSAVRLERLVKRYGDVEAVSGVTLDIADGEFFSMLGPSGSGKTTTLRMIAGFELPTEGRVLLKGRDVTGVPPFDRDASDWRVGTSHVEHAWVEIHADDFPEVAVSCSGGDGTGCEGRVSQARTLGCLWAA